VVDTANLLPAAGPMQTGLAAAVGARSTGGEHGLQRSSNMIWPVGPVTCVHPSVHLPGTSQCSVKTAKAIIMQAMLHGNVGRA